MDPLNLSPQDQANFQSLLPYLQGAPAVTQTTDQSDRPGILARLGEGIANAPVESSTFLLNTLGGIAQLGTPEAAKARFTTPGNFFAPPQAQTVGEKLADVPGQLLAQLPAYMLAEGAGTAASGSGIVGGAVAGAATSTDEGTSGMLFNAGLMGAMGGLGGNRLSLQRVGSVAGLAAAAGGYNYANTGDVTSAATTAGMMGIFGMLHAGPATTSETTPTVTQEKGLVPYNPGSGFTMKGGIYDTSDWETIPPPDAHTPAQPVGPTMALPGGGPALPAPTLALPDTDTRFTQGAVTTDATGRVAVATPTPGVPMLDDRSGYFQQGNVTSQPADNSGRFVLGADTTKPLNNQLPGPIGTPFQIMGPSEQIPSDAKQLIQQNPQVVLPEGKGPNKLQLPPDQTQVVSTAFQHTDGNVYMGNTWDAPHEVIAVQHGLFGDDNLPMSPPQDARGFVVHNADGTQTFENRQDALEIARGAGQLRDSTQTSPLNSTDLQALVPEKGGGDSTPAVPAKPDVTSQPAAVDHGPALERLRQIGASADPEGALRALPSADRQAMFEASRANGRKGTTIARLAENAKGFHEDANPTPAEPPPSPKDVAALGGSQTSDNDPMTSSLAHISDPDVRDDLEYLRGKITEARAEGDTDAANYKMQLLKTELAKHQPAVGDDMPKPIVTSQPAPKAASWLSDPSVKSAEKGFDQGGTGWNDTTSEESPVSFSDSPHEATEQLVDKTLDDSELGKLKTVFGGDTTADTGNQQTLAEFLGKMDVPDYDDSFEPKPEDLDEETRAERAEGALDEADVKQDGQANTQTDHIARLLAAIDKGSVSDEDLGLGGKPKPKPAVEAVRQARASKRAVRGVIQRGLNNSGDGAFVNNQLLGYLGRYAAGGLVGGSVGANLDKENKLRGFILGALIGGASLGHINQVLRFFMKDLPEFTAREYKGLKDVTSQPGARARDFLDNMQASGQASAEEPMLRRMIRDFSLNFTRSEDLREAMQRARTADLQNMADDAMSNMIRSGEYKQLTPAQRAAYEEFRQTKGTVVTDPVTGKTKIQDDPYAVTKFMAALSDKPVFAGAAVTMRNVLMEQQRLLLSGGAKGGLAKAIMDTIGKYSADQYKLFTSDTYRPAQADIDKVTSSLDWLRAFPDYDRNLINKHVESWLQDIYKNRYTYEGGRGGEESKTLDELLKRKSQGLSPELEARIMAVHPTASSVDDIVSSQLYLPSDIKEALWKQIKAGNYITPQWRDMTGLYTDPVQRDVATAMKIMPAVRAAKLFDFIGNGKNALDLPYALSPKDYVQARNTVQAQLSVPTDPKTKALLQRRLIDLNNRVKLPSAQNLGSLSEHLVSPDFANAMPSMNPGDRGGGPLMQAVMGTTKSIKLGQTLLNPISYVRWTWNAPFLGMLAGNNPFSDIPNGYRVAWGEGANAAIKKRLVGLGVMATDIATNDFNTTAKRAMTGNLDMNMMDRFLGSKFMRKAADVYGLADNAIRAATFLRREQDVLSKMAPDVAAGRVTSQDAAAFAEKDALRFTNRYTVDYGNVPDGLAACRKMPFFSLYMTYSYETSRILKNIMVDATGVGPYGKEAQAGAVIKLAALGAVPVAITMGAKAMLSPQDQKDWEKTVALMQPYQRARMLVPMGKRADGTWRYVDLTSLDPVGDWNTFGRAVASGDWRQVAANNPYMGTQNTPALNMATEIITGQNSRTGRQINTVGRALDTARQDLAPAFFGGYEFDNLMRAIQPNDQGGYGVTQMGSGKGYSIEDLLWTYATGVRPTSIRTDWATRTAVGEAQSSLTTERQYMMDTLQSDASQEAKDHAKKLFNDAATVIMARLKNRLDNKM